MNVERPILKIARGTWGGVGIPLVELILLISKAGVHANRISA